MSESVDVRELERQGWERRAVADEPRLSEQVALYEELGLEVLLVPLLETCKTDGEEADCTSCFEGDADPTRFKIIFTRLGRAEQEIT